MVAVAVLCDGASFPNDWRRGRAWDRTEQLNTRGTHQTVNFHLEDLESAFVGRLDGRVLDLVRIAAYAFGADMEISRGGKADWKNEDWKRTLGLAVPVNDPDFWSQQEVARALEECLSFVSDDRWLLAFTHATEDEDRQYLLPERPVDDPEVSVVVPFSGGMDSLTAVTEQLAAGKRPLLVTLEASRVAEGHRAKLLDSLRGRFPAGVYGHLGAAIHRSNGEARERTRRTRSFVVATLAVAASSRHGCPEVLLSDNGVVSLNLPISEHLVGATATRSTHPKFLRLFNRLVQLVIPDGPVVRNPYWDQTRADMLSRLSSMLDPETIADTRSCANSTRGPTLQPHCGYCSQCIDRRMAVMACSLDEYDPASRYEFDIFQADLPHDGERGFTPVAYVRFAQRIANLSGEELLEEYSQLYECIRPSSRMADLASYLSMLNRHSKTVLDVVAAEAHRRADDVSHGRLSPRSLLALVGSPSSGLSAMLEDDDGLTHSADYRVVKWRGRQFTFSPAQAGVVRNLHDAHRRGLEGLSVSDALEGSGLNSGRVSDALKRSGAWNALVIRVPKHRGLYRLDL